MSRHEGVSCDSCLKTNFRGLRYKCLICYDYDLCASCYESGATTTRHTTEHPMQCILTRSDFDLYYGGEAVEQPQSFTCPYCGKMGFTEAALQEHVTADHTDSSFEVICPVCAALPGGDPNLVTDDFSGHLTLEHRSGPRDLISFLDEPSGSRHGVRRIPHFGRTRGQINIHSSSSGRLSSLSPSSRDTVDPIAELLSQLSGVRRTAASQGSTPSQLQQLQMQLQLERQQVRAARQQLERLPRRQTQNASSSGNASTSGSALAVALQSTTTTEVSSTPPSVNYSSQLMLYRSMTTNMTDVELETAEQERADRSLFVQELVLTTLCNEPVKKEKETGLKSNGSQQTTGPAIPQRSGSGVATELLRRPVSVQTVGLQGGATGTTTRTQQWGGVMPIKPIPRTPSHNTTGTGTIREVVPPTTPYSGTTRRKPVRPVQSSEPPPSH